MKGIIQKEILINNPENVKFSFVRFFFMYQMLNNGITRALAAPIDCRVDVGRAALKQCFNAAVRAVPYPAFKAE